MRKYEEIWLRIKRSKNHKIIIEVHPALYSRVIKAVIKEKHMDLGTKVINDMDTLRLEILKNTPKLGNITFILHQRLGLEDMKVS